MSQHIDYGSNAPKQLILICEMKNSHSTSNFPSHITNPCLVASLKHIFIPDRRDKLDPLWNGPSNGEVV